MTDNSKAACASPSETRRLERTTNYGQGKFVISADRRIPTLDGMSWIDFRSRIVRTVVKDIFA